MKNNFTHKILTIVIASVWFVNGLFCKVLDLVPRHEQIVANILGQAHSGLFTILIGISEIIMAIWILTRYKSRLNAIIQMFIVATMNIMEFILVPELLLWGKLNAIFALLFIGIVFYNEFILGSNPKLQSQS